MTQPSSSHFGLIVAYILPGFIALAGMSPLLPSVATWLRPVAQGDLGLGPPVYAILAATAIGLFLSCLRWLSLDQIHYWMGVRRPAWDDRQLATALGGFDYLVQNHFRYYEFCGNTLIAALWAYGLNRWMGTLPFLGIGTDLGMVIVSAVLFAASRDALAKYYTRTGRLLGQIAEKDFSGDTMFNGNDHGHPGSARVQPKPEPKAEVKPQVAKPEEVKGKGTQARK